MDSGRSSARPRSGGGGATARAGGGGGAALGGRLRVVTWNVNQLSGSHYSPPALAPLLLGEDPPSVEIVVIGLQEVEMTVGSFFVAAKNHDLELSEKGRRWLESFGHALGPRGFVLLHGCQVMGQLTALFARAEVAAQIPPASVVAHHVPCGLMGHGSNKGGLGVRMELRGSSFCFLNCHLAAGHTETARRNADWATIARKTLFEQPRSARARGRWSLHSHDHVLVFGDLNFRIEHPNLSRDELVGVLEPLRAGMALTRDDESVQPFPVPTQLLQADQLGREKRAGRCFQGFDEAPITFAPTYKCESTELEVN